MPLDIRGLKNDDNKLWSPGQNVRHIPFQFNSQMNAVGNISITFTWIEMPKWNYNLRLITSSRTEFETKVQNSAETISFLFKAITICLRKYQRFSFVIQKYLQMDTFEFKNTFIFNGGTITNYKYKKYCKTKVETCSVPCFLD